MYKTNIIDSHTISFNFGKKIIAQISLLKNHSVLRLQYFSLALIFFIER